MTLQADARQAGPIARFPDCSWKLQTERLCLGLPDQSMAQQLAAWTTHPQISATLWPEDRINLNPRVVALAAWPRNGGAPVGELRLRPGSGQLSYFVVPALWGRGFATEMVNAVCEPVGLNLGLSSLGAVVLRDNLASLRVLEKSGFRFHGLTYASRAGGAVPRAALRFVRRIPKVVRIAK
jgi:RimJ/RimL family protein N-acetyltransferase